MSTLLNLSSYLRDVAGVDEANTAGSGAPKSNYAPQVQALKKAWFKQIRRQNYIAWRPSQENVREEK